MLNWIVSPSCKPFNAATRFVSFGPGLTLLAVLTVMTAACVTAQSSTRVTVEKCNISFITKQIPSPSTLVRAIPHPLVRLDALNRQPTRVSAGSAEADALHGIAP